MQKFNCRQKRSVGTAVYVYGGKIKRFIVLGLVGCGHTEQESRNSFFERAYIGSR